MRNKGSIRNRNKNIFLKICPVFSISFSLLLSSCQPKERKVGVDYINVKDGWIPEKFNFRSVSKGGWILEVWTEGAAYSPNASIDLSLRLIHKGKILTEDPQATVHLQIEQIKGGQARRAACREVYFHREAKNAQAWLAKIKDSFPRDNSEDESDKPIVWPVPAGVHVINVDVHLQDGTELKAEGMMIETGVYAK